MPVVPSFGSFAATPDVAQSFLGGARIASEARQAGLSAQVQRERIAAESAEAAARIAFGREQLAAQQVQNQMELDAKTKYLEQKALQDQQEAAIENAYRNIQLGIADRRLAVDERVAKIRVDEAAREFAQQQAYERRRGELIAGGTGELEASEQAMREVGFGATGFSSVFDAPQAQKLDDATKSKVRILESAIRSRERSLNEGILPAMPDKQSKIREEIGVLQERLDALLSPSTNAPRALVPPMSLTNTLHATPTNAPMRGLTVPNTFTNSPRPRITSIQRR